MALKAIRNGRGFFSDYWLGSIMGARKRKSGPHLTPAQSRKLMWRLSRLWERMDTVDPPDLTPFREKFARPLLADLFGYALLDDGSDGPLRLLVKADASSASTVPLAALVLEPDHNNIDNRQNRNLINGALAERRLQYGFILTPQALRLIRKPGEGHKNAFFDFLIATTVETEDIDSLSAAFSILSAESLSSVNSEPAPIAVLEEESRKHSAQVSEDLKEAVFRSTEMLIRGFLADVRERPEAFRSAPSLTELRDAALQALYRILFILYAESRDERLQGHKLYLESYSIERLVDRLLQRPPDQISSNRYGFWKQLLALFRIYDQGLHQGLPPLPGLQNIPPRGGTLFSEKTKEGQFLVQARLPDRVVADLLLTLATSRPRRGVGRERVSFRELAIEQLGAVYEGLLEYEPRVAKQTMIEVSVQGREFVLSPLELCRLCEQKQLHLKGPAEIVEGTEAAALHPDNAEEDEEENEEEEVEDEENGDADEEEKGLKKGAAATLIRRVEAEDFYFVPGSSRKSSGSYYTREEIVQYLVRNALEDMVKNKPVAEIESLRIIDPACGSAHFLVGAARYLGKKLYEAYRRELRGAPPPEFYPSRELAAGVREEWEKEGEVWCKRRIVEKCLFGVDLNPMAVQLAQVALWIESLAGDRPLSFFAHHIRCGNSLMGTWLERLHDTPHPAFDTQDIQRGLFEQDIDKEIARALDERLLIDARLPSEIRKDTPQEYDYKADRLEKAEQLVTRARLLFDLRNASVFLPDIWKEWHSVVQQSDPEGYCRARPWWNGFNAIRGRERFLHWELEFPEVFRREKKGFDAVLGNPPWDKVKPDRKEFYGREDILIRAYTGGELDARIRELQQLRSGLEREFKDYEEHVKATAASLKKSGEYRFCDWEIEGRSTGGDPDLFKFFVERGHQIMRQGGRLGFLVPSAIYNNEGCTGLRHLLLDVSRVLAFYGFENRKKIFNIHSSYKFVCLVLEKTSEQQQEFSAAFMRHDVEELAGVPPKGVQVLIRRSELERLSPGTLAFLEYRSERDREIILKMYGLLPGMERRPLLGDQGPGTWNAKFYTEFHMTNDRDLWTKPDGTLWTPKEVCGLDWPNDRSIPFAKVRSAMASRGFWPLYEGKHIEQFLIDIKPIDRWVNIEAGVKKNSQPPSSEAKVVIRAIASNTNERTCVAALIPEKSCFGHSLYGYFGTTKPESAVIFFNSFAVDYSLRFRVSANVSPTFLKSIAGAMSLRQKAPVHTVHSPEKVHITEYSDFWSEVWSTNRAVAEAYELSPDDFDYILSTFPVFARKRPEFYAYLKSRVEEWKREG